jgi:hypothetical protein
MKSVTLIVTLKQERYIFITLQHNITKSITLQILEMAHVRVKWSNPSTAFGDSDKKSDICQAFYKAFICK